MAHARRTAPQAAEVLDTASSPRREGARTLGATVRRSMAPTAIVGLLVATTTLTFVPVGAVENTSAVEPVAAQDVWRAERASRDFARVPVGKSLPAALYSPVAIPSVVPTPSPTPTVSATVEAVTPAAVPSPEVTTPAPEIVASAEPVPVETTPAIDWRAEGKTVGSNWATASVNVRTGPGTGFDVIRAVAEGSPVTVTDWSDDGWQQITGKSGAGWIKASFLTSEEPVAPTTVAAPSSPKAASPKAASPKAASSEAAAPSAAATSSETGSSSSVRCAKAGSATSGMTSRTVAVLNKVCANFSSVTSYGGYRAGSSGYHGSGQAIDAMVSGEAGWEVARWVRENASSLGVVEVIYSQKIWTTQRSGDGWRSMSDRGSASANHYDHVHISVG